MSSRLERLLSAILVLAAVAIAISLVHREFFPSAAPAATPPTDPRYIADWDRSLAVALPPPLRRAPVTLVEFVDFECPICSHFHRTLRAVMMRSDSFATLHYVHFPLTQHRFARRAAQAVECAEGTGHREGTIAVIYEKQDSLGLIPWIRFGEDAGVPDPRAFDSCISLAAPAPRIEAGVALGTEFGVQGTPALLVNGWMLEGAGWTSSGLSALVDALHRGQITPASRPKDVLSILTGAPR